MRRDESDASSLKVRAETIFKSMIVGQHKGPLTFITNSPPAPPTPVLNEKKLLEALYYHYRPKFNLIRLFDDSEVPISQSFIDLTVFKKNPGQQGVLPLEQLFDPYPETPKEIPKKILVIGGAGTGKSVLCQLLATQSVMGVDADHDRPEEKKEIQPIGRQLQTRFKAVFWFQLRKLADDPPNIELKEFKQGERLAQIIQQRCLEGSEKPGIEELNDYIRNHSEQLLFILDGWDEVSDRVDTWDSKLNVPSYPVLRAFLEDVAQHEKATVLVTSRPMVIKHFGSVDIEFKHCLECTGFGDKEVKQYVYKFLEHKKLEEKASVFIEFLKARSSLWEIAHTPMSLELLCWLKSRNQLEFDDKESVTVSKLYEYIVQRIQEANANKYRETETEVVWKQRVELFLERLAWAAMEPYRVLISDNLLDESNQLLRTTLKETWLAEGKAEPSLVDLEKLLKAASQREGFLVFSRKEGQELLDHTYSFIHLSFQEFYAARYIRRHWLAEPTSEVSNGLANFIQSKKYIPGYQRMLLLTAGLLYQAGKQASRRKPSVKEPWHALQRFWTVLEKEPRELFGYRHAILVMYCLEECALDKEMPQYQSLMQQPLNWLEWLFFNENTYYLNDFLAQNYISAFSQCLLWSGRVLEEQLKNRLKDSRAPLRTRVIDILEHLTTLPKAISLLQQASSDKKEDSQVRQKAVRALARLPSLDQDIGSYRVLQEAVGPAEKDWEVRQAVIYGLTQLPSPSVSSVKILQQAAGTDEKNSKVRQPAIGAFVYLPPDAKRFELLQQAADSQETSSAVRQTAIQTLGWLKSLDPASIKVLKQAASRKEKDLEVRRTAIKALSGVPSLDAAAVRELLLSASSEEEEEMIRNEATRTLNSSGPWDKENFKVLQDAAGSGEKNSKIRQKAIYALSMPWQQAAGVEVLRKIASREEKDLEVRVGAIKALDSFPSLDDESIKVLREAADPALEEDLRVREAAMGALSTLSSPDKGVLELLRNAVRCKENAISMRDLAIQGLGRLKSSDKENVTVFQEVASSKEENSWLRQLAINALSQLSPLDKESVKVLEKIAADRMEKALLVRVEAIEALGHLELLDILNIQAWLKEPDPEIRKMAIRELGRLKSRDIDIHQLLLQVVREEKNLDVRRETFRVFGQLPSPNEAVMQLLLNADDQQVREKARHELDRYTFSSSQLFNTLFCQGLTEKALWIQEQLNDYCRRGYWCYAHSKDKITLILQANDGRQLSVALSSAQFQFLKELIKLVLKKSGYLSIDSRELSQSPPTVSASSLFYRGASGPAAPEEFVSEQSCAMQ